MTPCYLYPRKFPGSTGCFHRLGGGFCWQRNWTSSEHNAVWSSASSAGKKKQHSPKGVRQHFHSLQNLKNKKRLSWAIVHFVFVFPHFRIWTKLTLGSSLQKIVSIYLFSFFCYFHFFTKWADIFYMWNSWRSNDQFFFKILFYSSSMNCKVIYS